MTRTDYLGSPIRVAAALALFLPGTLAKSGGWMALGGLVAAVLLSWFVARSNGRLPRSRAAVLGIPALWLGIGLVVHTIAMAGSTIEVASAILASAVSAVAWWKLERRRAGVLAIVGGSVE